MRQSVLGSRQLRKVHSWIRSDRVNRRRDLCVIFEDLECDNSCVENSWQETDSEDK
jgi:hypothetical protein